jgi:aminoglycoside/choline kinase family phosphotransferase
MHNRTGQVGSFLGQVGWFDAERRPIAGDMSSRRYTRLSKDGRSAVLMDAETDQTAFVKMTIWLADTGLSVPRIIGAKAEQGLILLEDLGSVSLKQVLDDDPAAERTLFEECIDLLMHIRTHGAPELPCPTATELVEWTRLADDHYPGLNAPALTGFRAILKDALEEATSQEASVSLRDFHAENIMWMPGRQGIRRFGLLDYQDAFLTHPVYDVVSLLTDARRFISTDLRDEMIDRYIALSGENSDAFRRAFASFAAQRNLRILGIFTRAGRHLELLPNVYRYFCDAIDHELFSSVRDTVRDAVPAPTGFSA